MTYLPDAAGVVVIGAGVAGSAAAAHLSAAGVDVLLLERSAEGDARPGAAALTPAAVRELEVLGLPESDTAGWHRTTGVRFVGGAGGGMRLALAWPDAHGRATHGLTVARAVLDDTLAAYAVRSGARLRRATEVTGVTRDAAGRVTGVTTADGATIAADVVVDASGGALATAARRSEDTGPVAVSADFDSPRHGDDHVEAWLRLATGDGAALPGHGWIIGRGDGRVTVGVGALADDTTATTDACAGVLRRWLAALPANWGLTEDTMTGPVAGSRLAAGPGGRSERRCADGLLAVGDSAAVAHPVTGEGVAAALTSARLAAVVVARALAHPVGAAREAELTAYDDVLDGALGRHRTLGRAAARILDRPLVTRLATTYALPRQPLMKLALAALTTPTPAAVETCVTPSTMGRVTRAADPGTERGVDQR
ncbi:NAD(P)/FAD-dependent oxidoreductase [Rothia sp. ARF10]|nr:NAD(P)/FAD-dependent oxidoreductase [Rothia sp. ARF10]